MRGRPWDIAFSVMESVVVRMRARERGRGEMVFGMFS